MTIMTIFSALMSWHFVEVVQLKVTGYRPAVIVVANCTGSRIDDDDDNDVDE